MAAALHRLNSAFRLSPADWILFLQAWIWLLLFDIGLRTCRFLDLKSFAARLVPRPTRSPEQTERLLGALMIAINRARRNHLYPMTCLRGALALQKMLAERGVASDLRIGVRKEAGQLNAHAWLEYQGKMIGEAEKITEKFSTLEKSAGLYKDGDQ